MPRKKQIEKCDIETTDEHYKAQSWCFKKGIKVYPKWVKKKLKVEIYNPLTTNRLTLSKESYTNCESQQVIWDLYIKLHNKYKKLS